MIVGIGLFFLHDKSEVLIGMFVLFVFMLAAKVTHAYISVLHSTRRGMDIAQLRRVGEVSAAIALRATICGWGCDVGG